jgi:hypothetical protein
MASTQDKERGGGAAQTGRGLILAGGAAALVAAAAGATLAIMRKLQGGQGGKPNASPAKKKAMISRAGSAGAGARSTSSPRVILWLQLDLDEPRSCL